MNTPMCTSPWPSDDWAGVLKKSPNGSVQPPKNSTTISAEPAIIAAYSPMKNSANRIELYSVL